MTDILNIVNVPVAGSSRFQQDTAMAIARLRASLGPEGTPTFSTIALPGLAGAVVRADTDGVLQTVAIGSSLSYSAPTLNTIQGIRMTDSPTFAGLTLTGLSGVVTATAGVLAGGGAHADLAGVTADQHHARSHTLTSTSDHTSAATAGQLLQADANGLPIDASVTDAAVASAVTASHDAVTLGTANGLSLAGQELSLPTTATPTFAGLGIGAAPSGYYLDIQTALDDVVRIKTTRNIAGVSLLRLYASRGANTAAGDIADFTFQHDTTGGSSMYARVNSVVENASVTTGLGLSFKTGGVGAAQERVRIAAGGNVGFGISSPLARVHSVAKVRADTVFNCNGTDGITTTFVDADGNTISVVGGIITAKTAP